MKRGRNEPCRCGSGKKYKACCAQADATRRTDWSKKALLGIGAALLLGAGGFVYSVVNDAGANEGKIWSEEHGHWHNAVGTEVGKAATAPRSQPAPPGPAPAGKVWSDEHGHWHDAP